METETDTIQPYEKTVFQKQMAQQKNEFRSTISYKEQQKLEPTENIQQELFEWENYTKTIQSFHKKSITRIDWHKVRNYEKPIEPKSESQNETNAVKKLLNFKPTLFDKLFGTKKNKTNRLKSLIEHAKQKDIAENSLKSNKYLEELKNWETLNVFGNRIENKEIESYKLALDYFNPFSDIETLGTQLSFNFESNHVDIDFFVNPREIIPTYELKQTTSGKLIKKNMPRSTSNELYQNHICSTAIRIAREVFAYLPIEYARINAVSKIMDSKTGHIDKSPILSVIFPPKIINHLNVNAIDPADSMRNFIHNMDFSLSKGFNTVVKAELKDKNNANYSYI